MCKAWRLPKKRGSQRSTVKSERGWLESAHCRRTPTNRPSEFSEGIADASADITTDSGTSNITVADSEGRIISLTTTVGLPFGSRIITEHGFVLNDTMDDFSVSGRPNKFGYEPSVFNYGERRIQRPNLRQCRAGSGRSARSALTSSQTARVGLYWQAVPLEEAQSFQPIRRSPGT